MSKRKGAKHRFCEWGMALSSRADQAMHAEVWQTFYIRRDADHEQKGRCEAPVLRMGHGVKFPCRPSHARRGLADQA